ncbi:MAG: hypothetical protein DMF68_14755 [Acidobacteria bacterium]|nr:MAG: hypothetical protein DMF68_14755 [Acidobacteriota bacterium]
MIRPKHLKVCPQCLSESAHIRRIWEFALVTACPIHKCLLLDKCPNCGKRITWARSQVAVCSCRYDWRKYNSNTITASELQVTQQIYLLCGLCVENANTERGSTDQTNPLYRTGLQYFVAALVFVASQLDGKAYKKGERLIDTTGKNFARNKQNTEIHVLLCKAWSVFNNWPDNYFQFLEWRRLHIPSGRSESGLSRDFVQYKSALYYQLASEQLDFMRAAFEEYLVTRWDGGSVAHMRRISQGLRIRSRYVSRKEAKKLLCIAFEGVDRLIAKGKLKAIVRANRSHRAILIDRSSVESFKYELENSLNLKQVKKSLGVTKQRVFEMIECGLLNPLEEQVMDGRSDRTFSVTEVKCLLATLRGKLLKIAPVLVGRSISFPKALKKLVPVNIGIGRFIQLILEGTILPVRSNTKLGLASLLFSDLQIENYIMELERIQIGETFSAPEVAKRLGIGVSNTYFLIRKGLLQIHRQSVNGYCGLRINKSTIDLFNSTYVFPAKVAQQLGTSSSRLTNLLIMHDIKPVSGSKVDGGMQYIFRRAEIEKIDLKAIWQASKHEHISRLNERKLIGLQQAASLLGTDQRDVLDLIERGILKPHRHLPRSRHKNDGPFVSMFTIEKHKDRTVDYSGLVSSTVAAKMLGVTVPTLHNTYIPKKLLQIALDGGKPSICYFWLYDVKALIEARENLKQNCISTVEAASLCNVSRESIHDWLAVGLLQPITGTIAETFAHNLYLRDDVEQLYAEREAFKAKRISEGGSSRFGSPCGPKRQPVREKVAPRLEQLFKQWNAKPQGQPVSGQKLLRQLVQEGYHVGINTIYVCLHELRQQAHIH